MKRFGLFWAAMCLAAALATACGGSNNSTQATGTATATASASGSEATSAPPGAQIAIKNNDSVEHSVTSDTAGKFTVDVDGNEQGTLTAPSEPGEYAFHCKYHPSMLGTLIVK